MTIYIIILLISIFLLLIRHDLLSLEFSPIIIFFFIVFLFIIEVFRGLSVGVDYGMYHSFFMIDNYEEMRHSFIEPAYAILTNIAQYFDNFYILPFIVLFMGIIGIACLNKQFRFNKFTLWPFFVITGIYVQSFDILRQYIAIGFICIGFALFFQLYKLHEYRLYKYLIYLLFIYIAFNFHKSAIVGIVFLILPKINIRPKAVAISFIASLILAIDNNIRIFVNNLILNTPYYSSKYGTSSLTQTISSSRFSSTVSILFRLIPISFQFLLLYFYVKRNYSYENYKSKFILSGYLIYLISSLLITFWGNSIRRMQLYFLIFPMFYSCMYMDEGYIISKCHHILNIKEHKSSLWVSKLLFIILWIMIYISKLFIDNEKIVPYNFI